MRRDKLYMRTEVNASPSTFCFVNFTQKKSRTVLFVVMDCSAYNTAELNL
jgi:hypothetical protein